MAVRKIIEIDEELCTGCGECIPNCPEGAIQMIDGKARLVSDIFCDGLGACLGNCPEGAITVIEREAEPYNERLVAKRMVEMGPNVVHAHLKHLKDHGEMGLLQEALEYLEEIGAENPLDSETEGDDVPAMPAPGCTDNEMLIGDVEDAPPVPAGERPRSELTHWPVQLNLVSPQAPFLKGRDLVVAADCVPVAMASFHQDFLRGRSVVIGCPKFDDPRAYLDKFTQIFTLNDIKKVILVHMEVPCCFGLRVLVDRAVHKSGKAIEVEEVTITVEGKEKAAGPA